MSVHEKVAETLGMAVPEDQNEICTDLTVVEPHEIKIVDNPDLPDMTDIEKKFVEGEKQAEELIVLGIAAVKKFYAEADQVEPQYKGRYLETFTGLYGNVRDAIRNKLDNGIKRAELRMKEVAFRGKVAKTEASGSGTGADGSQSGTPSVTNFIFSGDRKEVIEHLRQLQQAAVEPPPVAK